MRNQKQPRKIKHIYIGNRVYEVINGFAAQENKHEVYFIDFGKARIYYQIPEDGTVISKDGKNDHQQTEIPRLPCNSQGTRA